jgi:acid phosphatase type 7
MTRRAAILSAAAIGAVVATGCVTLNSASHARAKSAASHFGATVTSRALALPSDPVIAAAGDIACDPTSSSYNGGIGTSNACRQREVSDLLVAMNPAAVLSLGDNQYYCGGLAAFQQVYDPTWGRLKAITHPVVGNHEYLQSGGTGCNSTNAGAAGYFNYFGTAAGTPGQGYYSFDIGAWHLIAINSNCTDAGGCSASSPQAQWLAADLAAHSNMCTLAYWHIPLFSSGGRAASNTRSIWAQLYAAGVDVVLTGHDHIYERFARQTDAGVRDDHAGIREFVVGTGGANHTSLVTTAPNSEVRDTKSFGVLKMTLHPDRYDWQFQAEGNGTLSDHGSETCHGKPTDTSAPSVPTSLAGSAPGPGKVSLSWSASTDTTGVANYTVKRDGVDIGSSTTTSYDDITVTPGSSHSYQVYAVDYNGWASSPSTGITVAVPPDTTPPSAPTGLIATALTPSNVTLSWTTSTDDSGIADYRVFRNGVPIGTATTTSYADGLTQPETSYSYTVSAVDLAGNESGLSSPLAVTTPAQSSVITLAPIADTYVEADKPTSSFGTAASVGVDGSPLKRVLLKFIVTGVNGRPVQKAVLRLYCINASTTGGILHQVIDTAWTESVTWNNAPAAAANVLASLASVHANTWYEIDVTPLIKVDGTYALDMTSTNADGADYDSREAAAGVQPQLVVTTG